MSTEKSPLSADDAVKLLDLLCTDDVFRQEFSSNPATAMQRISPEAAYSCRACSFIGTLASKSDFERVRNSLLDQLETVPAFRNPHSFALGTGEDLMQLRSSSRNLPYSQRANSFT